MEKTKVQCHKCGHEWETASEAVKVTCPSCSTKTDRKKENKKVELDEQE